MPTDDTQRGNGTPDYWAGVRQGRMMTRIDACVCTFDEDGNGPLNVCGAHREWLAGTIAELEAALALSDAQVQRMADVIREAREHISDRTIRLKMDAVTDGV